MVSTCLSSAIDCREPARDGALSWRPIIVSGHYGHEGGCTCDDTEVPCRIIGHGDPAAQPGRGVIVGMPSGI